jgi:hypothetical protein
LLLFGFGMLGIAGHSFAAALDPGEVLYRQGVLPSGAPLTGERDQDTRVTGADAACAKCHRRSGLGSSEGQIIIPPITGDFLFRVRGRESAKPDLRAAPGFIPNRKPYDAASLATAIREGVDVSGRQLSYLMPRYNLSDSDITVLTGYLQQMAANPAPGVSEETLHFATIITPDADPMKRQAMLDVLNQFFADKNEFIRGGIRPMHAAGGVQFRVSRRWQLHVWELTGPADGWAEQLDKHLASEPVFAVISGLGGSVWEPIHRFCERNRVPCLFPNTDLPVISESDFYNLYFYRGVILEADLMAQDIEHLDGPAVRPRLLQIFRKRDLGAAAAAALEARARRAKVESIMVSLDTEGDGLSVSQALRRARPTDIVALWLRPADIAALPKRPPADVTIYVSGLMTNLESAPMPAAWRDVAHMTYPFDPPDLRKFRMNYPLAWMKVRHIALTDERVQSNTYLACGILAEELTSLQDNFVREFLLERIEDMLSHRVLSAFYPRLGLAPGQRFASKGGYFVHFIEPTGPAIAATSEWIVP